MRELPNGDKLILNLQFATQGVSAKLVELVGQDWKNVGIDTTVKEVTTDEYRSAQSSNQLDVTMFAKSQPLPVTYKGLRPFDSNDKDFFLQYIYFFALQGFIICPEYDSEGNTLRTNPMHWAQNWLKQ